MQFEISKTLLNKRLSDLNSVVDSKSTDPIRKHIYLDVDQSTQNLTLLTSNKEITLRIQVSAKIERSGKITVPCDKFVQIVQRLDENATVHCSLEDNQFLLSSKKSKFKLSTLPAEDYPVISEETYQNELIIDASELSNALNKIRFSVSKSIQDVISGVSLKVNSNKLDCATTDGHRLSCAQVMLQGQNGDSHLVLPEKTVNELIKHLSLDNYQSELNLRKSLSNDIEEVNAINDDLAKIKNIQKAPLSEQVNTLPRPIKIHISDRKIALNISGYEFTSSLLSGKYPNYEEIIPKKQENPILIDKKELLSALQRAKILLTNKEHTDGIRLSVKPTQMIISMRNIEGESSEEVLDIINSTQMEIDFSLNVLYLIDTVSNLEGDNVQVHVIEPVKPCLITSEASPDIYYIIMPMFL